MNKHVEALNRRQSVKYILQDVKVMVNATEENDMEIDIIENEQEKLNILTFWAFWHSEHSDKENEVMEIDEPIEEVLKF